VGFIHRPEFLIIESTTCRKLDVFSSSGEGKETPVLLGTLERGKPNRWTMNAVEDV
jgi:hypothetical protein